MQSRSAFVTASLALVSILAVGACTGVIGGAGGGEGPAEGDGGSAGVGNGPASSGEGGTSGAGVGGAGGGASAGGAGQGAGGGGASSTASSGGGAGCGDKVCGGGESCETCPMDCGACCGNGVCSGGETCMTCATDCGACEACLGAGPATTALDAEEQGFLGILNDYRAQNGLPPLAACTSLNRAAQGHSEDMRDQNYFSHDGKNGSSFSDRACDACYDHACPLQTAMAENIAAGNGTADATFTQWKNSAGHNANMLGSSYKVIGIGRATDGGDYGVYWTTVFGGDTEASCN
ncbi:CAP domain-containing protein [Polyangium jinanense]|uniref:CAP domain-containing protein n=1 Tax=Polyangium jinanense TaxID=2829994 RepID=A0A9X3X2Q2_9BACT|nr:CAP domain-containing protein [Polyangium jinanense]MDC3981123.1 CAP domain-containing protein [Polyangium jinanense]